jgi:hypothetical protein
MRLIIDHTPPTATVMIQCTTATSLTASSGSSLQREKGIMKALKELFEWRNESNNMSHKLLKFIQGQGMVTVPPMSVIDNVHGNLQPHDVLKHISKTRKFLTEYTDGYKK